MCSASVPTGSPAVKATTRTSAPGSKPRRAAAGFTLLELMIVMVIVAVATGLVTLTLRDRSQSQLETEAARLAALLETARTQSRIVGTEVRWKPLVNGFEFSGLPPSAAKELPSHWLEGETTATVVGAPLLRLGPEPLLPAQRVVLHLDNRQIAVGTDGLSPFQIVDGSATTSTQ
ncbi:MAG TPA: prepilin-type N-terminal cleavage/methylation domain-containing protein [Burkholderiaceae bacterium]